jgi:DNA-binding SARP family transcriptional activator
MQVRLLGPVDVVVDGEARAVHGLRRKAVLATLALQHGEVVSVDQLVDVVWGESAPSTVRNTLQSHVSYLRTVFGSRTAIRAQHSGYVLEVRDGTDVQHAQRRASAGRQGVPAGLARRPPGRLPRQEPRPPRRPMRRPSVGSSA